MKRFNTVTVLQTAAIAGLLSMAAVPAYAQNNGGIGAVIGGSAGAIIGGSVDNRGSNTGGTIAGAAIGGTLGYLIGSQSSNRDRQLHNQYYNQPGQYYRHSDGYAYRRYHDPYQGTVSIRIGHNDPYYYADGRARHQSYNRGYNTGYYGHNNGYHNGYNHGQTYYHNGHAGRAYYGHRRGY